MDNVNSSTACLDCAPTPASLSTDPASNTFIVNSSDPSQPVLSATVEGEEILPPILDVPRIIIEFCDRCRWAPRATWTQTELFLSFPSPLIRSITLQPLNTPETGGRFRIWLDRGDGYELIWDRKTEGGFPELKVLKQRIRNLVQPGMSLGHSDGKH